MKKAYIFDFDGTLADSMPTWAGKIFHILHNTGTPYPEDLLKQIVTLGDKGAAAFLQEKLGLQLSTEEIFAMMDEYALPRYANEVQLKKGVREYLQHLKQHGATIHVLTASPHKMVDPCLKRTGVYDWFDNIWSCDDFGMTKSQPEIYHAALASMGLTITDGVFFDDSILAVRTAVEAGLFTVGVHDALAEEYTQQIKQTANLYIENFRELLGRNF